MIIPRDKKTWSAILLIASAGLLAYNWLTFEREPRLPEITEQTAPYYWKVRIKEATVKAEVAWTPEGQQQGLSGRASLPDGSGMIFVFPKDGIQHFWMKDMNFPIDIIWLSYENKVTGFVENATPESFPESFPSTENTRYVLEVNAGFVKQYGIRVGEIVRISDLGKSN